MKKRASVLWLACAVALSGGVPVAQSGCSSEGGQALCDRLSISAGAGGVISVFYECSGSYSAAFSNVEYDMFGNRTSYDFTFGCSTSSVSYTGSVTVSWSSPHDIASWTVVINGETCSFSG
jgi:hypothetical protein